LEFPRLGQNPATGQKTADAYGKGNQRKLSVYSVARTVIERHIKVRGEANPYQPESVEYFEKRRGFAWRTYPVGKTRAFAAG